MKNKSVLQLITGLNVGGAEKVVYDLSLELNNRKYKNFVVCISDKAFLAGMFKEAGIRVEILKVKKDISSFITGIKNLYQFVKNEKVTVIHAHMTHALIVAMCIKIVVPSIKIVFTSHNFNVGSKIRENLIQLLKPFRSMDIIFSKKMMKAMYKDNATVIPNGINTSLYDLQVEKNKTFTFLSIGRIEIVKNHRFLVDAAIKLQSDFDFEIHIVGDGILREELVQYIEQNNVQKYFKFLGYRKDVNVICNQSHVFVMPSLWEGLPISLLEAGASAMPVISTPVGSIPELVDDKTGYLVELNDFVEKMKYVYNNYSEALVKGNLLKEKIKAQYDLKHIVDEHIKIYEAV